MSDSYGYQRHTSLLFIVFVCVVLFFLLMPAYVTHGATTTVVYQSDFSADPEWITDQPENFYWDSTQEALFMRTLNRPDPNYSPSRHYYTETTLNPRLSYELTWDMNILSVQGDNRSGVAVFGLYGDRLHGFNQYNLNFAGNDQDGTFSMRLMTLEGISKYVFTEVNPGFNYDIGEQDTQLFSIGTWYTMTERYTAGAHQYYFEIKDRTSGDIIFTNVINADPAEPVNPDLNNLGISMHPEGTGATNLAYGTRINGSAEYLIDNVTLTQVYDETYTEPSSVLFLPGIQASRLYTDGILGTEDRIWEPNHDGDVAQLEMTEAGQSIEDLYTRDVIDSIFGFSDVYGSFLTYLDTLKSQQVISDWTPYAYDWRYAVSDIVRDGTKYEAEQRKLIESVEALAKNNNSHVTIIAHSNGGLLAKALVVALEEQDKSHLIDRIILVASPQLGTPKAIGSMLHGYDQEKLGGLIITDETAREVIRNFPGAYGLLPSDAYFTKTNEPVVTFDNASSTEIFSRVYGTTVDSSDELIDFMVGTVDGRPTAVDINEASHANADMLRSAQNMHRATLDAWIAPTHIQVFEIVGVGLDTVKGFEYQEFIEKTCISGGGPGSVVCAYDPYYEPVPQFTQYGDETVVASSAEAYSGSKQTYYVDLLEIKNDENAREVTHSDITSQPSLQQFIGGLLQRTTVATPFIYTTMPSFTSDQEVIGVHSPATLVVTDSLGNMVGKPSGSTSTPSVNEIPGSAFFEVAGATYIIMPSALDYTATVLGVGEGSYTLTIEMQQGETLRTRTFTLPHATVTPDMSATFSKTGGEYSDVATDYDGDGVTDTVTTLNGEPPNDVLFMELRTVTSGFTLLKQSERDWLLNAIDRAERTSVRKGSDSASVARIFAQITDRLTVYRSNGLISTSEYETMFRIMNEIISR